MSAKFIKVQSVETWCRLIRDHAPPDKGLMLALYVLATYMDHDGVARVSLRTWATASGIAVNTLQKHRQNAEQIGWIVVSSRACPQGGLIERSLNVYQAAVPKAAK